MHTLVLDTETDIYNNGNPFDARNKLVCVSWKVNENEAQAEKWDNSVRQRIQNLLRDCDLLLTFNGKFDYHWLYNNGVDLSGKRIWDCQTAHYILSNQTGIFPSLDEVLAHWGLPCKLDVVKKEYWDKGITTSLVPWDTLREYAILDAELTSQVFHKQWEQATEAQRALILCDGDDCHVLREMEENGLYFDRQLCDERAASIDEQLQKHIKELASIYPQVPVNFNSGDHLSAFLYGGEVTEIVKEHVGFYKTGAKAGQPKYQNAIVTHKLPRLYQPIKGSELKKPGYYATNEPTLRKLKGKSSIINSILEISRLEKLSGTYYKGLPALYEKMNWADNVLHGNFNQTQTATGRLSSSRPNQQNFAEEILDVFVSRMND